MLISEQPLTQLIDDMDKYMFLSLVEMWMDICEEM